MYSEASSEKARLFLLGAGLVKALDQSLDSRESAKGSTEGTP